MKDLHDVPFWMNKDMTELPPAVFIRVPSRHDEPGRLVPFPIRQFVLPLLASVQKRAPGPPLRVASKSKTQYSFLEAALVLYYAKMARGIQT